VKFARAVASGVTPGIKCSRMALFLHRSIDMSTARGTINTKRKRRSPWGFVPESTDLPGVWIAGWPSNF
jgi:hypothetical protein